MRLYFGVAASDRSNRVFTSHYEKHFTLIQFTIYYSFYFRGKSFYVCLHYHWLTTKGISIVTKMLKMCSCLLLTLGEFRIVINTHFTKIKLARTRHLFSGHCFSILSSFCLLVLRNRLTNDDIIEFEILKSVK